MAWVQESARRSIDELFTYASQYQTGPAYIDLLNFVAKFKFYAPYNAMLVHIQMPGAEFVAPAERWLHLYQRRIQPGARPILILQPMGPVMFVFDVSDTVPMKDAPPVPLRVTDPFKASGTIGRELELTEMNAQRDGVQTVMRDAGSQLAGRISTVLPGQFMPWEVRAKPEPTYVRLPVRYAVELNKKHDPATQYATMVHELAHLYCGHLGTPEPKWWPDRSHLRNDDEECEAESVCHLVCARLGIKGTSAEYLSGYLRAGGKPQISIDGVLKAAGLIESMGRERLPLRRGPETAQKRKLPPSTGRTGG